MKVAIIGNGILGLTIAYRLVVDHGVEVTLVGPSNRVGGATPAAGAMLNSMAELTEGSLDSEYALEYFGMSYLATQMWPDFEKGIISKSGVILPSECSNCQGLTGGCFGMGTYVVNNTRASELEDRNYRAIREGLRRFDTQFYDVEPSEIPNYEPDMLHRAQRALFIPNEGWLNPKIFLDKLDRFLSGSKKVTYIDSLATEVTESKVGISKILLKSGETIEADHFVLATGVHSRELLVNTSFAETIQPLYSSVGISIEVKLPNTLKHTHVIRTPNRGGACGIYTVPYYKGHSDPGNNVLIGASSVVVRDPRTFGRIVSMAHLMHASIKEINQNFHNAEFVCSNVGNRPTTLDQYPLIGRLGDTNISMVTGTKRDGFHLSPLISKLVAESILEGKNKNELQTFRPDRALIRDLTRAKAIEMTVSSKIDEAVQHGFVPSSIFQLEQMREDWTRRCSELHEQFGAEKWGIPSQMFNVYLSALDNPQVPEKEINWLKEKSL